MEQIELAAKKAACLTRPEYNLEGLDSIICYDLARLAAQDRGYSLCLNIDIDPVPYNIGSAILRMVDDARALQGHPRKFQDSYRPRVFYN